VIETDLMPYTEILSAFLALMGLVTVTVAFANDGITPISSIGIADEPVHVAACNGDYWCCSNWFGCHCKNGMPEVVKSCQKGTHCVHDGGSNFHCQKGRVANDEVTPLAAIEASLPIPTEVAPVDDPVHAAACNGDYWCCDKWHGCQCVNGMPKAVANCQKGTHCVYQGNGSVSEVPVRTTCETYTDLVYQHLVSLRQGQPRHPRRKDRRR
jgi:hypothetical protein